MVIRVKNCIYGVIFIKLKGGPLNPHFLKALEAPFLNVAKICLHHRNQYEKLHMYPGFYENLRGSSYP